MTVDRMVNPFPTNLECLDAKFPPYRPMDRITIRLYECQRENECKVSKVQCSMPMQPPEPIL